MIENHRHQFSLAIAGDRGPGESLQGRQVVNRREEFSEQTDTRGLHGRG